MVDVSRPLSKGPVFARRVFHFVRDYSTRILSFLVECVQRLTIEGGGHPGNGDIFHRLLQPFRFGTADSRLAAL